MAPGPLEVSKGSYKRVLAVLFHVTKMVNQGAPLMELLKVVSQNAGDLVGADSCSIMLLDEARKELLCKASAGLSPEEEDKISFKVGEGVAGWVAEHAAPALISDVRNDPRFKIFPGQVLSIQSLLAVPMITKDGVIGTMTVTSKREAAFGKDHEELLLYLGGAIVRDIENARLYRISITDSLTKAFNRQYLFQRLPAELERTRRYGDQLSVILFDVDHFKKLNDKFGHLAGDFVLKELVRLGQTQIREVDALVRYGGEEFLVILPATTCKGAQEVGERLRAAVERADFLFSDQKLKVTVSLGCAEFGEDTPTDEALLRKADERLYQAKTAGRNRVV